MPTTTGGEWQDDPHDEVDVPAFMEAIAIWDEQARQRAVEKVSAGNTAAEETTPVLAAE